MTANIDGELRDLLLSASRIVVLTGAGVSAESGIPTFRDALTGFWAHYRPEDLATPAAFSKDPQKVSQWYDERRHMVASCLPNQGHLALAELQRIVEAGGRSFTLITHNIDRLHQAAGSRNVLELHGTLWVWRCLDCGVEREERGPLFETYPRLCECGGVRRPGVVWFGEDLPAATLLASRKAAGKAKLFISVGTSNQVQPAASLAGLALANGARLVEVNPNATDMSPKARWKLVGASGTILPELLSALNETA